MKNADMLGMRAKSLQLLQSCGLQPARLLCPWDFPGKNTGVGSQFLLQGIFLIQGLNAHLFCLLHWQVGLFCFVLFFTTSTTWEAHPFVGGFYKRFKDVVMCIPCSGTRILPQGCTVGSWLLFPGLCIPSFPD